MSGATGHSGRSRLLVPLAALSAAIVVFFLLIWLMASVALPFIVTIIVAYLFSPIVDWLERHHVRRGFGALAVLAVIFGCIAGLVMIGGPLAITELEKLMAALPGLTDSLERIERELETVFPIVDWGRVGHEIVATVEGMTRDLLGSIPAIVSGLLKTVYFTVIIPFLLFFFLKDGREILQRLVGMVPNRYFEMSVMMLYRIDIGIGRFLRGILIENSAVGGLAIIGLSLIGMPGGIVVGLLVGLFNFIPYMGPTIGYIIAGGLSLIDPAGNPPLLAVLAVLSTIHVLDNIFFYPVLVGRSVHMHPINVIAVLLLGGFFLGFLGMLLAVPLATSLVVVYRTYIAALREYRPLENRAD